MVKPQPNNQANHKVRSYYSGNPAGEGAIPIQAEKDSEGL